MKRKAICGYLIKTMTAKYTFNYCLNCVIGLIVKSSLFLDLMQIAAKYVLAIQKY